MARPSHAADTFASPLDVARPTVRVSGKYVPQTAPRDGGAGEYGATGFAAGLTLPIVGELARGDERATSTEVLAETSGGLSWVSVPVLNRRVTVLDAAVGVTGVVVTSEKNLYLLSVAGFVSDDVNTLSSPAPRPLVLGVGTWRTSDEFAFLYGAAFTYSFGKALPLPILGCLWQPAKDLSLEAILPLFLRLSYRASKDVRVGFVAAPAGSFTQVANGGAVPGQPDTLHMRLTQFQLGGEVRWAFVEHFDAVGQASVLGARQIALAADDDFYSSSLPPAVSLAVKLEYVFGTSPYEALRARKANAE